MGNWEDDTGRALLLRLMEQQKKESCMETKCICPRACPLEEHF